MKRKALVALIVLGFAVWYAVQCNGAGRYSGFDRERLIQRFDQVLNRLDRSRHCRRGYILSDREPHRYVVKLTPVQSDEFINMPLDSSFKGVDEFFGRVCLVSGDLERVYISKPPNFSRCASLETGEEIPGMPNFYLTAVNRDSITVTWAYLYDNTELATALVDMYHITSKEKYLDRAKTILYQLIDRIDSDGRQRIQFYNYKEPQYRGMAQSILMQALDYYLQAAEKPEPLLQKGFDTLLDSFKMSHENCWNHWSNAVMGLFLQIRYHRIGKERAKRVYQRFNNKIKLIYSQIRQFKGKIPYTIKTGNPVRFKSTYQTLDTKLLAMLDALYTPTDMGLKNVFPMAFAQAKKVNYSHYGRNNLEALYYAARAFGYDEKSWRQKQFNRMFRDVMKGKEPRKAKDFMLTLTTIPLLIKFQMYLEGSHKQIPAKMR